MSRNSIDFSNIKFTESFQDLSGIPLEGEENASHELGNIVVSDDLQQIQTELEDNNPEGTTQIVTTTEPVKSTGKESLYTALLEEMALKNSIELPKDLQVNDSDELLAALDEYITEPLAKKKIDDKFKDANPYVKKFLDVKEYFDDEVVALDIISNLQSLDSLTDTDLQDEQVLEALYREELITVKGLSKDEVDELVDQAKTLNKLDTLGAKSKKNLDNFYNSKLESAKESISKQKQGKGKKAGAQFDELITYIDEVDSLGSFKLPKEVKEKAKKNLTTVVKNKDGKLYNDFASKQLEFPNEVNLMIEVLNTLGVFNIDKKSGKLNPDFSKLQSFERKTLERKLDRLIEEGQSQGRVGTTDVVEGSLSDRLAQLGY